MAFPGPLRHDPRNRRPTTVTGHGLVPVRRRLVLVALVGLLALALSACGTSDAATDAPAADPAGPTVTIKDLAYTPATLTVGVGTTVSWVWRDRAMNHNVKGDGFRSRIKSEGTFSHRFTQPGTYPYLCTLHPSMTGTIEVTR